MTLISHISSQTEDTPSPSDSAPQTDALGSWLKARGVTMLRPGFQIDPSGMGRDWMEDERLKTGATLEVKQKEVTLLRVWWTQGPVEDGNGDCSTAVWYQSQVRFPNSKFSAFSNKAHVEHYDDNETSILEPHTSTCPLF